MRKHITLWLVICMVAGLTMASTPIAAAEEAQEAQPAEPFRMLVVRYAKVATEKGTLNMRDKPQDNAEIIAKLPRGSIVQILEELDGWTKIISDGRTGYAKSSFIEEVTEFTYDAITKESDGQAIMALKKALYKLDYLKSDDVNQRFDIALEKALTKVQLMNGLALNPLVATPELQTLMEWGELLKGKSGYLESDTDKDSNLSVAVYCWDSGGVLYEDDESVKVTISFAAGASGGHPPYDITVRKSISATGGQVSGDIVTSPFSFVWNDSKELYLFATVVDALGNTVTTATPFRYTMPERYQ